jgi:hypothetical protein
MTHASMDAHARATAGINDSLVRLSVGIELAADLVHDIIASLDGIAQVHEDIRRTDPPSHPFAAVDASAVQS